MSIRTDRITTEDISIAIDVELKMQFHCRALYEKYFRGGKQV